MASKRRRVIQAEDSSEEHRPVRRGSSPSREQSQQATSGSDQEASGSDQDSSEHSSGEEDSSGEETDDDSSGQEEEDEQEAEGGGSEVDEGSDDSKAQRKARKKRAREKREKLRRLQTHKAVVQENENVDLPYNPDKKFERQYGQPMVELKAGSNVWYQAYIMKESANEVKVKVPGVNGKRKALIEWLNKGSSRIWRGSLKQEHWKHLGKGSWKPKASAFSTIKSSRAERLGNGGASSGRRTQQRSAQLSEDQHISGASVGNSTEQRPAGNGQYDEEVVSPRPQPVAAAEAHTLPGDGQQQAGMDMDPVGTEDDTISDEAGAGKQDGQHIQHAGKIMELVTGKADIRPSKSPGPVQRQKPRHKSRQRLLLEPRPSMSDADHASTHSQHVAESPGLLADQNSTRALSSMDDAGFEQQQLLPGGHNHQAAAAHAILAHHQHGTRHHQHPQLAGLDQQGSTHPAASDPLTRWFLQHMTTLAATGMLGGFPDSSMEAGGLPDGFAYNPPTRQVVLVCTGDTPGSEPAHQEAHLPHASLLQPGKQAVLPSAAPMPAAGEAAAAAAHDRIQGRAAAAASSKEVSKQHSQGAIHATNAQPAGPLDAARKAAAGDRQGPATASPPAGTAAPAPGSQAKSTAALGSSKGAGQAARVGGPINGTHVHGIPGSKQTGFSPRPLDAGGTAEGKPKEARLNDKPASRPGTASPRDSPGMLQAKQAVDKASPAGNGAAGSRPPASKGGQQAGSTRGSEGASALMRSKTQAGGPLDRWPSSDVKLSKQDSIKASPTGAGPKAGSRPSGLLGTSSKPSSPIDSNKVPAARQASQQDVHAGKHTASLLPTRAEAAADNTREERDGERGRTEGGGSKFSGGVIHQETKLGGSTGPARRPAGQSSGGADPMGGGGSDRNGSQPTGWDVRPSSRPGSMGGARPSNHNNSTAAPPQQQQHPQQQPSQQQGQQTAAQTPATSPSARPIPPPPPHPPPTGTAALKPSSHTQSTQQGSSPSSSKDGAPTQSGPTALPGKPASKDGQRPTPSPYPSNTRDAAEAGGPELQRSVQLQLPPQDERRFKSGGGSSRRVSPAAAVQGEGAARSSFGGFGGAAKASGNKRPANLSSGGAGPPSKGMRRSVIMADDSDEDDGPYLSGQALGSPQPSVVTEVQGGLEARHRSVGVAGPVTAHLSQGGAYPRDANGPSRVEAEGRGREDG